MNQLAILTIGVGTGIFLVALQYGYQALLRYQLVFRNGCASAPRIRQRYFLRGSDFLDYQQRLYSRGESVRFQKETTLTYTGRTATVRVKGETWLLTANPENVKAILTTQANKMHTEPIRKEILQGWIGDGMFGSDGERWQMSRNMFKPMFARATISQLTQFEKHVDRLFEVLPPDGTTIDLQEMFKKMYLDSQSETFFGRSFNCQGPGEAVTDIAKFQNSFDHALAGAFEKIFAQKDNNKAWQASCDYVHGVIDEQTDLVLEERKRTGKASDASMLHSLVEVSQDKVFIRDQLLNVFIGTEAPAPIGIAVTIWNLARSPNVYEKLRDEVLAFGDQALTFESLKSLKLVKYVIAESLRLHSPVGVVPRLVKEDCALPRGGGPDGQQPVFVAKGSRIEISLFALHVDPQYWGADVHEWKPERWENMTPKWEYTPFVGGPRICPAQQMMLTQYAFFLVKFVQRFKRVENRDPVEEFVAKIVFSQQSKHGVKVALYQ